MIVVILKEYLERLKREELVNQESERRYVPNFTEIARAAGLTFKTISKLANNGGSSLNKRTLALVITALREEGFNTKLSDIVIFQTKEEL